MSSAKAPRDTADPAADKARAPNLMVATVTTGGRVHVGFAATLLDLRAADVAFSLVAAEERLPTHARNALLATFCARPGYSHLLFLDPEISVSASAIVRLLAYGRDVVAAPVALEGAEASGEREFDLGHAVGESGSLLIVDRVGAGVLLLSRRAADALIEEAKSDGRVYERPTMLSGEVPPRIQYDVFRAGAVDGEYLAEDAWACRALRRLGFAIHVDPAIVVRRSGEGVAPAPATGERMSRRGV